MSTKKLRSYSRYATEAVLILGKHIQLERKLARMSERELSERIGITRTTLQKIERGDLNYEIGSAFEAAAILGIPLFGAKSRSDFSGQLSSLNDRLTLLPKATHAPKKKALNDAF